MKYFIDISVRDWFVVFIFGTIFGGVLGALISILTEVEGIINGLAAGVIFGLCIFVYSYIFINLSNRYILKKIKEKYWEIVSLIFSFFSGFLGSLTGYWIVSTISLINIQINKNILILSFIFTGILTAVIANLLYRVVNLRKLEAELEKSLITAKLKALEYQINPHFLFNTLNVIAEIIHIDQQLAEKAVLVLSKYLREIIDEKSLLSVEKELEIVKNYMFIQNLRFPDIKLSIDVEDQLLNIQIPKLSLQVLVENAVIHGLKSKGNVSIKGYKKNGKAVFEVIDNGEDFKGVEEGTGLKNLKARLKLLLDGELRYYRKDNKTIFIIEVPFKRGKK